MSKNYLIEYANGITRIQFYEKPTYSEAQNAIDDIAENFPYEKRLWDLSNIYFDFTVDELKAIAAYGKLKFIKPNKMALIAPDTWAFIELSMFNAYRNQEGVSVSRVFRAANEAIDWLNSN